jgi:hypothetical protein
MTPTDLDAQRSKTLLKLLPQRQASFEASGAGL